MLDGRLMLPLGIKDASGIFDGAVIDKGKIREVEIQIG